MSVPGKDREHPGQKWGPGKDSPHHSGDKLPKPPGHAERPSFGGGAFFWGPGRLRWPQCARIRGRSWSQGWNKPQTDTRLSATARNFSKVVPWLEGQLTPRGFKRAPVVSQGYPGLAVRGLLLCIPRQQQLSSHSGLLHRLTMCDGRIEPPGGRTLLAVSRCPPAVSHPGSGEPGRLLSREGGEQLQGYIAKTDVHEKREKRNQL